MGDNRLALGRWGLWGFGVSGVSLKQLFFFLVLVLLGLTFSDKALAQEKYVAQIMSLATESAARTEADNLMAQGVPSFQRAEEVPGAGLRYRVYMGPFDTANEAKAAAEALKSQKLIKEYFVRKEGQVQANAAPSSPARADSPAVGATPPAATTQAAQPTQPAQPTPGSPATNQEYWPVQKETPPVTGNTNPADWPPPNESDNNWGAPRGGAAPSQSTAQAPAQTPTPVAPPPIPEPAPVAVTPTPAKPPTRVGDDSIPSNTPVLGQDPQASAELPLTTSSSGATIIPAKPTGPMKIQGFVILSDLSSSMRDLSPCSGRLVKEEAATTLLRKMNQRIPSHPYMAALRVFGYKRAWTRKDYTTLYFGPQTYDRGGLETAIERLYAADSISPFGSALNATEAELAAMTNPRAIFMVSDFEETADPGDPVGKARSIRQKYGQDTRVYAFYVSHAKGAAKLAEDVAKAGGGEAWDICTILDSETEFERMMSLIFGPRDLPPCRDSDADGVCDERDQCPNTPRGAPVDGRGCWIAAFSQFFDFDKAEVKYSFQPRLKAAAEILIKNPQLSEVVIAGHTDDKGTDTYNMELGRRRAEAVRDLLVKFGAPAEKLKVVSFGKTRPIAPNDTEENRAKNRRVEFHVGDIPK